MTCTVPKVLTTFFFNDTATTEIYTLSLHDALPISAIAPRPYDGDCRDDGAHPLAADHRTRLRDTTAARHGRRRGALFFDSLDATDPAGVVSMDGTAAHP